MKKLIIVLILCVFKLHAIELNLNSDEKQTQIIELFTSEGCSSCPPADRWISSLKTNPRLWQDFIPVSYHVDYWDYLGWKDPFSSPAYSMRQQMYKAFGNLRSVYTPGLLRNGKEWHSWRMRIVPKSKQMVGKLSVKVKNNQLIANFSPTQTKQEYQLNVLLLGMNISIPIKAGENRGKKLNHDFVVLKHEVFDSKNNAWNVKLNNDFFNSKQKDLAFVVWIQNTNNPAPIQAVGVPIE